MASLYNDNWVSLWLNCSVNLFTSCSIALDFARARPKASSLSSYLGTTLAGGGAGFDFMGVAGILKVGLGLFLVFCPELSPLSSVTGVSLRRLLDLGSSACFGVDV